MDGEQSNSLGFKLQVQTWLKEPLFAFCVFGGNMWCNRITAIKD